jgi:Arc/MetJ-type ribon-helix-helix transcriptional regulator
MKQNIVLKKPHARSIRTTITLTPVLFDACRELVRKGGYNGLSDYLQAKIRRDAKLDQEDVAA